MGFINLTLRHKDATKNFILTNADFLKEAWFAEVFEDGTTKIHHQFKCRRFKRCFGELSQVVQRYGTVVSVTGNEVDERTVKLLSDLLIERKIQVRRKRKRQPLSMTFFLSMLGLGQTFRMSAYS